MMAKWVQTIVAPYSRPGLNKKTDTSRFFALNHRSLRQFAPTFRRHSVGDSSWLEWRRSVVMVSTLFCLVLLIDSASSVAHGGTKAAAETVAPRLAPTTAIALPTTSNITATVLINRASTTTTTTIQLPVAEAKQAARRQQQRQELAVKVQTHIDELRKQLDASQKLASAIGDAWDGMLTQLSPRTSLNFSKAPLAEFDPASGLGSMECPVDCSKKICGPEQDPQVGGGEAAGKPTQCVQVLDDDPSLALVRLCRPFEAVAQLRCPKGFDRCAISSFAPSQHFVLGVEAVDGADSGKVTGDPNRPRGPQKVKTNKSGTISPAANITLRGFNLHNCMTLYLIPTSIKCDPDNLSEVMVQATLVMGSQAPSSHPTINKADAPAGTLSSEPVDSAVFAEVRLAKQGRFNICVVQYAAPPATAQSPSSEHDSKQAPSGASLLGFFRRKKTQRKQHAAQVIFAAGVVGTVDGVLNSL